MPELPDVEALKRYLDATALHHRIDDVHVHERRVLEGVSADRLRKTLRGRELAASRRHGKWLFASAEGDGEAAWLALHFGMTGFLAHYGDPDEAPGHVRVSLDLDDGSHLAYDDQRLFGEVGLVESPDDFVAERDLGPDALDIDLATFRERLEGRSGTVKSTLMNQAVLAGIGNEYSDEILFQARIHPKTPVGKLSGEQVKAIHRKIGQVLEGALGAARDGRLDRERFPGHFLNKRREEGARCPGGCGGEVETLQVSGRTAYFCPRCQEAP